MNRNQQSESSVELALRPAQLNPGDVILSASSGITSWTIRGVSSLRERTKSLFSHAALYVGGGYVIEAVNGGVHRVHVRALRTSFWGTVWPTADAAS